MRGRRLVIGALLACLAALLLSGGLTAAFTLRGTSGDPPQEAQAAVVAPGVGDAGAGPPGSSPLTAVPKLVNFQGRLTNPSTGDPVPDGTYSITFRIFNAASGGTQLWSETQSAVAVTNGQFNVLLGSVSPLTASVLDGDPRYLEVKVGEDPAMTPRLRFATVPYAFHAENTPWSGLTGVPAGFADNVDSDVLAGLSCANGQVAKWNSGAGQWQCANDLTGAGGDSWSLTGNSGTNPSTNFLGTTDNQSLVLKTNGTERMRIDASGNVGIGTSSPTERLYVLGAAVFDFGSTGELIAGTPAAAGPGVIAYAPNGNRRDIRFSNDGIGLLASSSSSSPSSEHGIRIDEGGRVGIGILSPSAETQLHVRTNTNDNFGVLVDASGTAGSEIGLHTAISKFASLVKNAYYAGGWNRFDTSSGAFLQQVAPDGTVDFSTAASGANPISWQKRLTLFAAGPVAGQFKGNLRVLSATTGATVVELGEGLDYAEGFDVSSHEDIGPGTVLIIDPHDPGKLAISGEPYDSKVAGVVAGANDLGSGVRLGGDQFDYDVALAGRVYANVDATYGEVSPGDLLTTSPTPGYAMVVKDYSEAQGAILGKAMQGLAHGEKGQILVLVTLQ
jgi:hypothetical protein